MARDAPPFASDHARLGSFARPGRDPAYAPHDDTRSRAVVLSGLPGAGKDHWIATHHEGRPTIALLADSRAHVTIVAVAAPRHELRRRNQERRRPGRVEVY